MGLGVDEIAPEADLDADLDAIPGTVGHFACALESRGFVLAMFLARLNP